jgi:hypothetical protein
MLPTEPIGFFVRLIDGDGNSFPGIIEAQFDNAEYVARDTYPDYTVTGLYPVEHEWRYAWIIQKHFRRTPVIVINPPDER